MFLIRPALFAISGRSYHARRRRAVFPVKKKRKNELQNRREKLKNKSCEQTAGKNKNTCFRALFASLKNHQVNWWKAWSSCELKKGF
jgi:hypothetical protein